MRPLLDTNIFLEALLKQEKASESEQLLLKAPEHLFFISDYSLHSIGMLLFRRQRHDVFRQFVRDVIVRAGTRLLTLQVGDMDLVADTAERFGLDFDDAYQFAVAQKWALTVVTFDRDFERTTPAGKTPAEILGA